MGKLLCLSKRKAGAEIDSLLLGRVVPVLREITRQFSISKQTVHRQFEKCLCTVLLANGKLASDFPQNFHTRPGVGCRFPPLLFASTNRATCHFHFSGTTGTSIFNFSTIMGINGSHKPVRHFL